MTTAVKRQYRSALREAQARETRRAIVSAAHRLFVQEGYGATTIDAVAAEAGVSRKTVFTAVGGKVELLKLALDWAVAGDDEAVALMDRPEIGRLLRGGDPSALLHGWARVLTEIDSRITALSKALDVAAGVDPAARSVADTLRGQRLDGARKIVNRLVQLSALRTDLTRAEATDLAWLAGDPFLYDRLVNHRGWSPRRFEAWLARDLVRNLAA
jgi:AcrR family transcriptional regulator